VFETVLVANRGEIARRVIRTVQRMGLRAVAVHSEVDAGLPYVREADEAVGIGPAAPAESYRNAAAVLEAARQTGAEAIHPGYGFLAEDHRFALQVKDAGLVWVGPSSAAIEAMGDKRQAMLDAAEKDGTRVKPEYGSIFYNLAGPEQARANAHMTVAVPGATTQSTGLPDNNKMGGAWIMNAGTSTAHIMVPGH